MLQNLRRLRVAALRKQANDGHYTMGARAIVPATVEAEAFAAHCLSPDDNLINALSPAEKAFIAALRLLLDNGSTSTGDAAAKGFLEAASTRLCALEARWETQSLALLLSAQR
jgi:hypothetical protein